MAVATAIGEASPGIEGASAADGGGARNDGAGADGRGSGSMCVPAGGGDSHDEAAQVGEGELPVVDAATAGGRGPEVMKMPGAEGPAPAAVPAPAILSASQHRPRVGRASSASLLTAATSTSAGTTISDVGGAQGGSYEAGSDADDTEGAANDGAFAYVARAAWNAEGAAAALSHEVDTRADDGAAVEQEASPGGPENQSTPPARLAPSCSRVSPSPIVAEPLGGPAVPAPPSGSGAALAVQSAVGAEMPAGEWLTEDEEAFLVCWVPWCALPPPSAYAAPRFFVHQCSATSDCSAPGTWRCGRWLQKSVPDKGGTGLTLGGQEEDEFE